MSELVELECSMLYPPGTGRAHEAEFRATVKPLWEESEYGKEGGHMVDGARFTLYENMENLGADEAGNWVVYLCDMWQCTWRGKPPAAGSA